MSYTTVAMILTLVAVLFYGLFVLYGTWSAKLDGRRQALRDQGLHPVTDDNGQVHAQEEGDDDGSYRG